MTQNGSLSLKGLLGVLGGGGAAAIILALLILFVVNIFV